MSDAVFAISQELFQLVSLTVWHAVDVPTMPGAGRGHLYTALGLNVLWRAQNLNQVLSMGISGIYSVPTVYQVLCYVLEMKDQ